jgi:hypothetical protein
VLPNVQPAIVTEELWAASGDASANNADDQSLRMRFIGMGGWGCWLQRESSAAKQDTYYKYHKYHILGSSKPFFRFFTLSTLRKLLTTASVC